MDLNQKEEIKEAIDSIWSMIESNQFSKLFSKQSGLEENQFYQDFAFLNWVICFIGQKDKNNKIKDFTLRQFIQLIINYIEQSNYSQQLLEIIIRCLMRIFIKENITGPSFSSPRALDSIKKDINIISKDKYKLQLNIQQKQINILNQLEIKEKEIQEFSFVYLKSSIHSFYYEQNLNELSIDGMFIPQQIKFNSVFNIVYLLLKQYSYQKQQPFIGFNQILLECIYLYIFLLDDLSFSLFEQFRELIKNQNQSFIQKNYSIIFQVYLQYHKYEEAQQILEQKSQAKQFSFNLIGVMGFRTKYQQEQIPLLDLQVNTNDKFQDQCSQEQIEQHVPENIKLDTLKDNILVETNSNSHQNISVEAQALLLNWIHLYIHTQPQDQINISQLQIYIEGVLKYNQSWAINFEALFLRSVFEYQSNKKLERCLHQIDQLILDWHSKRSKKGTRQKNIFEIPVLFYLDMIKRFAKCYKESGNFMSQANLLKESGLYEDCIEAMILANNIDQAMKFLKDLPKERQETVKMLCILGSYEKNSSFFERALEKSNGKSLQALTLLGLHYFTNKQFDISKKYLLKCVELNWISIRPIQLLAFIFMQESNVHEALKYYQMIVTIDGAQSEAWANIALLQKSAGDNQKALSAINQAVKINEWQPWFWSLYCAIAFDNQKINEFIRGIGYLVFIDHVELLTENIIKQINILFEYYLEFIKGQQTQRSILLLLEKVEQIYIKLIERNVNIQTTLTQYILFLYRLRQLQDQQLTTFIDQKQIVNKINDIFDKQILELMYLGWQKSEKQINLINEVLQQQRDFIQNNQDLIIDLQKSLEKNILLYDQIKNIIKAKN